MYHLFLPNYRKQIFLHEHGNAKGMGLISQAPYPLWFRYGLALPASCLRANDNPFDAGKVYRTDVVKHGFKGHMVMSAVDVLVWYKKS